MSDIKPVKLFSMLDGYRPITNLLGIEVLGDDIKGFCSALAGEEGAKTYRDKWREQLNHNIAKKLGK